MNRSTLLMELLCVLVVFIGVLAATVDARYLVPLTPVTFYVMFVCVQAVRSNGGHTVLFPAALFSSLLQHSHFTSSSASTSSFAGNHHLLPRALFPVRRELPPSAHLSPVSSAASTSSVPSPSSAGMYSPSSTPAIPRSSSEMSDAPLPASSPPFALRADTLSPSSVMLSPISLRKPTPAGDDSPTPVESRSRRERSKGKEEKEDDTSVDDVDEVREEGKTS